jgi:hypothetical protein
MGRRESLYAKVCTQNRLRIPYVGMVKGFFTELVAVYMSIEVST